MSIGTLYTRVSTHMHTDIPREPVSIFDMQALSLYRRFWHRFLRRFEIRTLYRFPHLSSFPLACSLLSTSTESVARPLNAGLGFGFGFCLVFKFWFIVRLFCWSMRIPSWNLHAKTDKEIRYHKRRCFLIDDQFRQRQQSILLPYKSEVLFSIGFFSVVSLTPPGII